MIIKEARNENAHSIPITINNNDVVKLKVMYLKRYGRPISDQQAVQIGERLISVFKVISKPIDITIKTPNNGTSD